MFIFRSFLAVSLLVLVSCGGQGAPVGSVQAVQAVRVIDGDTLVLDGERIRLHGIDAPELRQTCDTARGEPWACGRWARDRLSALIGAGSVQCETVDTDRYGRSVARCWASAGAQTGELGTSLNAQMVALGAATAYRRYSHDYIATEDAARREARGVWGQGGRGFLDPAQYRRARQGPEQTAPNSACLIKGNISRSGRIFHRPGQRDYARTRIDTRRGERWFCSAAEARAAGWRAARN